MPKKHNDESALQDYANEFTILEFSLLAMRLRRKMPLEKANEFRTVTMAELDELRRVIGIRIRRVEERFLAPGSEQIYGPASKVKKMLARQRKKVARLNQLATLANECTNIETFRRVHNKMKRILYGEHVTLQFKDAASDPDLLDV